MPFRRDLRVSLGDERGDDRPIECLIESYAKPSARADIGRYEIVTRIRDDERLLRARRSVTPDRHAPIAMVVVQKHHEQLVADAEGRRTPRNPLRRVRKGETDPAHSLKRRLRTGGTESRLFPRPDRDLRSVADGKLRGLPHLRIDQHEKRSRPRHDFALEPNPVDGAADPMTAPARSQCARRDVPPSGRIERHFEGQTLVALEQRRRELSSACRHIRSRMILSSASRGGRLDSSIEHSG